MQFYLRSDSVSLRNVVRSIKWQDDHSVLDNGHSNQISQLVLQEVVVELPLKIAENFFGIVVLLEKLVLFLIQIQK